jgi:hypothetical protein
VQTRAHSIDLRSALVAFLLLATPLISACERNSSSLASTLPQSVNGKATTITVIDSNELSGLATDDALAALGKNRSDARIVTAVAAPDVLVIGIAVNGVTGSDLLGAVVSTWPVSGETSQTVVAGRPTLTKGPPGSPVCFFSRGSAVYVVEASQAADAASAIAAIP